MDLVMSIGLKRHSSAIYVSAGRPTWLLLGNDAPTWKNRTIVNNTHMKHKKIPQYLNNKIENSLRGSVY